VSTATNTGVCPLPLTPLNPLAVSTPLLTVTVMRRLLVVSASTSLMITLGR
jgi:hypothetical protein